MSRFLTPLVLQSADEEDDGQWIVRDPLRFQSDLPEVHKSFPDGIIEVPAGERTDLASVPRLPIVYWLAGGTATGPAVVHDYLYRTRTLPRAVADAVLREASAAAKVPAWRRWMMWAGVRIGGGSHYEALGEGQQGTGQDPYFG